MLIASDNQRHGTFLDTPWRGICDNVVKKIPDASETFDADSSLAYFLSDESALMNFFKVFQGQ